MDGDVGVSGLSLTARLAGNERWIHIATTATNSQQPIPGSGA
jgi:hypothetical protein